MDCAALVIPCFNERNRLRLDDLVLLATEPALRLVFVDDGSTDGTADALEELRLRAPGQVTWFSQPNRGKAEAVRAGLLRALEAGATLVGYLDADLSTPPSEARRLIDEASHEGIDVVLGSRVALLGRTIERSALRHVLGRVFATGASLALGLPVYDTQCGAKVFRATPSLLLALQRPFRSRWAFDVELLGRLVSGGEGVPPTDPSRMVEVPLREWRHVSGSKINLRQMLRAAFELVLIARDLARTRRRR